MFKKKNHLVLCSRHCILGCLLRLAALRRLWNKESLDQISPQEARDTVGTLVRNQEGLHCSWHDLEGEDVPVAEVYSYKQNSYIGMFSLMSFLTLKNIGTRYYNVLIFL